MGTSGIPRDARNAVRVVSRNFPHHSVMFVIMCAVLSRCWSLAAARVTNDTHAHTHTGRTEKTCTTNLKWEKNKNNHIPADSTRYPIWCPCHCRSQRSADRGWFSRRCTSPDIDAANSGTPFSWLDPRMRTKMSLCCVIGVSLASLANVRLPLANAVTDWKTK